MWKEDQQRMIISGFYMMDCMEGMKQFPDKFFDLAIVDPPYGINVASHKDGKIVGGVQTIRWPEEPKVQYTGKVARHLPIKTLSYLRG